MCRVLVVDDDTTFCDTLQSVSAQWRWSVSRAADGASAVRLIESVRPAVAFVELTLPDMSGLDVLRAFRTRDLRVACVVITNRGDCRSAVDSIRLGAVEYLEKPVSPEQAKHLITEVTGRPMGLPIGEFHSLRRWADVVVRAVSSPSDFRTVGDWGRFVGVSAGGLRNWCRTAGLSPRRSLLLARILRAVVRRQGTQIGPENLLDVVDGRTLAKMLTLAGASASDLPVNVAELLRRQRLIDSAMAIESIRQALSAFKSTETDA